VTYFERGETKDLTRKQFLTASGATAGALLATNAMGLSPLGGPDPALAAAAAAAADSGDPSIIELSR
jgi:hypothetical protein